MEARIDSILATVRAERLRQFEIPGTEHDVEKSANDWIATIASNLTEAASRSGLNPTSEEFERSMVKTAAIAVAAIEYIELMKDKNRLS